MEAITDGSYQPGGDDAAHLAACAICAPRLARARAIEGLLSIREMTLPPPSFTTAVMARIGQEHWKSERVIDLGFNLVIAAGILVTLTAGAGLAWSLGLLTITIDLSAIVQALDTDVPGRVLSQVQTVAMAAAVLTMTLVLWWWAEAASN